MTTTRLSLKLPSTQTADIEENLNTFQGEVLLSHTHDVTCFILRSQPLHFGHCTVIREALSRSLKVILLLGSAGEPRTQRNPWSFEERREMILKSFPDVDPARFVIKPLYDWTYQDDKWVEETQKTVNEALSEISGGTAPKRNKIALIGHAKDATSFYLNLFPMWDSIGVKNYLGLDATRIRTSYFSNMRDMWLAATAHHDGELKQDVIVTPAVHDFLAEFAKTDDYKNLLAEIDFVAEYRKQFDGLKYPPIFVTVDAVITQQNHILLAKRKALPGKGLWCLPGGYVEQNQTILEALVAEIQQETSINLSQDTLLNSIKASHIFDDPKRSPRGRIITHAYLIELKGKRKGGRIILPEAAGGNDPDGGTSNSQWFPISEVRRDMMFEDHFSIINVLRSKASIK